MSIQSTANKRPYRFIPDAEFEANLRFSVPGLLNAAAIMQWLGHRPSVSKMQDVLAAISKDEVSKRNYLSDLECSGCGQKFEAKWKSKDEYAWMIGPDMLEKYASEDSIIVITTPHRIRVVKATELYKLRERARLGFNHYHQPYLDFSGLHVPTLLEIHCDRPCQDKPDNPKRKKRRHDCGDS